MCDQLSLRSACTYGQSDQSLCLSLEYSMTLRLLIEHHLEFLRLKDGCTGSFEFYTCQIPHCWKSYNAAHLTVRFYLFRSKLQVEDMREIHLVNKDATWKGDKDVTSCKLCEKPFSVARRKVCNNIWAVTCDFQQCGMLTYIDSH